MKNARFGLLAALLLLALASRPAAANPFEYQWKELAPGVWAGIRQDPFELPQEGNTLFVVTNDGVVVFDAGGSPLMGESIVAKVRSVTDEPVTHVVISHWHGDHMRGLQAIQAAFPKVAILCHPHSREMILATQDKWLKRRVSMVPNIRKGLGAALAAGKDLQGRPLIPAEKKWLEDGLSIAGQLDSENNRTAYVIPNATFDRAMTLHLGGRDIELLQLGNAHTAGDVVLWLPKEKIVATGDVVTAPVPLMPSPDTRNYPAVLDRIKALQFTTLVPGHGAVEHDAAYLDLLSDAFRSATAQMKALVAKGVAKDEAVGKVDLSAIENRFTHGDPFLTNRFRDYVGSVLPEAAWAAETGEGVKEVF